MKNKPSKVRKIGITYAGGNLITFNAPRRIANDEFKEFGILTNIEDEHFSLTVDSRYDFDEVVDYIREYEDPDWGEDTVKG